MTRTPLATPTLRPDRTGDLLAHGPVRRFVTSRFYPGVVQVPVTAVFGLVAYELVAGPAAAHDNAGTALMWVLWWPVLPLVFVLLGRFWCAVCPFGLISDLVQKAVGLHRPVPVFLKRYGIWLIDAAFLAITWADHVWGVVESPWGSGVLLLLLTTAVVVSGALFARRTFCRYLCFLGGLSGNYARAGGLELRADPAVCATCTSRAACFNGGTVMTASGPREVPGCPMFTFARTMDSSAPCTLCANCVTACPNDALRLRVRVPTSELWTSRSPKVEEAVLAMAIMGIVLIQNVTMLGIWADLLAWLRGTLGLTQDAVVFTLAFAVAVSLPIGLLAAAAGVAARGDRARAVATFTVFGYALIPLDVAGHVAHNLFHLLAEGGAVVTTLRTLVGAASTGGSTALVATPTIQLLQFTLLLLGIGASAYTALRLSRRGPTAPSRVDRAALSSGASTALAVRGRTALVPVLVVVAALGAANLYLFTLPMAMRM